MDITIQPGKLSGTISAIPSKSQAHRLLICAAFADRPTGLICADTNRDIEATVDCLNAMGAKIQRTADGYEVHPITHIPQKAVLNCCESGSTLRFLLPVAGALGLDAEFQTEGRLPQRPLSPLWEEMERMGCILQFLDSNTLRCSGQLQPGVFHIDGGVSSQFITGLLLATSLLSGESQIVISGKLESKPYVDMTKQAMDLFGVKTDGLIVPGGQHYRTPGTITVEGDWSNAAFWLAAQALGSPISIKNLNLNSLQGDKIAAHLVMELQNHCTVSATDIPDLVPILSVVAAANQGAVFTDIQRLRLKESDRIATTIAMLESLGGKASADADTLTIYGTGLCCGTVDSAKDHRIAMSAAIASTVCRRPVTVLNADCVKKSYPNFWNDFTALGGIL